VRITLRQLEIFRAVALSGTTTGASALVPLSQSATSAAVNELERSLGAKLFDRIGKRLLLNDSGRTLLPAAQSVLDGAHSIEGTFGEMQATRVVDLRACASTTVGAYVLPRVLARYGSEPIRLTLKIGNTQEVIAAVSDFDVDIGFIEGPCHEPAMNVIPWLWDELVIVASPDHALAQRTGLVTGRQLAKARWLLREAGSGTREEVEEALRPHLSSVPSALTIGSNEAIKNAVIEGLGISCLSRSVVRDDLSAGRLRILTTRLPPFTRQFTIIHHRKKLLSESLHRFIAQCQAYAAEGKRSKRMAARGAK
jgi:DNA-binding transcriptional LysR family regulator